MTSSKQVLAGLCLVVFNLLSATHVQAESPQVSWEQVNGYDVYLVDLQQGNQFGFTFAVPYGSADDPPRMFGRAHLFEHMMGRGSLKFPGHETMTEKMSSLGYFDNAETGMDYTAYYAQGHEKNALEALEMTLSSLEGLELEESSFAREKKTVINEVVDTAPNDPERSIFILPTAVAVPPGHSLHGYPLGDLTTLVPMSAADLHELHRQVYRPGIVRLAVFGNFTSGKWTRPQILQALKDYLPQNFKRQEMQLKIPSGPLFDIQQGPQILEIQTETEPTGVIYFSLPAHVDINLVEIFAHSFSESYRGGIENYLTMEKNWISSLSSWTTRLGAHRVLGFFFGLTPTGYKNRDKVVQTLISAIKKYQKQRLPEAVLAKVRQSFERVRVRKQFDLDYLIKSYPGWLTSGHEHSLVMGNWQSRIQEHIPENVLAGAQALDFNRLLVVYQGPTKIKGAQRDPVYKVPYKRRALEASTLFPIGLPIEPATVLAPNVQLEPLVLAESPLLKTRSWRELADGWSVLQTVSPDWKERSLRVHLKFSSLTALDVMSLHAWVSCFNLEFAPELKNLYALGFTTSLKAKLDSLALDVTGLGPMQLSALKWLAEKLLAYNPNPQVLKKVMHMFKQNYREVEFGFPGEVAMDTARDLLSKNEGLRLEDRENALALVNIESIRQLREKQLLKSKKILVLAGNFYESEVHFSQSIARRISPQDLTADSGSSIERRLSVQKNQTYFEPWKGQSGQDGVGAVQLLPIAAPSRIRERAALAVVRSLLHDRVFIANRDYGYVQGVGSHNNTLLDSHLQFYGQANDQEQLRRVQQGWFAAREAWQNGQITDEEIEKTLAGRVAYFEQEFDESSKALHNMHTFFMDVGHPFYSNLLVPVLKGLSIKEIREVASRYLRPSAPHLTVIKGTVENPCDEWLTDSAKMRDQLQR
ncbi:MAG: insulinase family protein [Bdellovibrionales bacterium]